MPLTVVTAMMGATNGMHGIRPMGLMCRKTTPSISTTEKGNRYNLLATHHNGNIPSCRAC